MYNKPSRIYTNIKNLENYINGADVYNSLLLFYLQDPSLETEEYIVKTPYLYLAKKSDITRLNGTVVPASFGRDKMLALDGSKPKLHRGYKYLVEWIDEVVTDSMTPKVKEQVDITKYLQIRD